MILVSVVCPVCGPVRVGAAAVSPVGSQLRRRRRIDITCPWCETSHALWVDRAMWLRLAAARALAEQDVAIFRGQVAYVQGVPS